MSQGKLLNINCIERERERRVIRVILQIRFQFSNVIPKTLGYLFPLNRISIPWDHKRDYEVIKNLVKYIRSFPNDCKNDWLLVEN